MTGELSPVEEPGENILQRANVVIYDEYDMYDTLRKKTVEELKSENYSNKEIAMLKENTYESVLRERGKLSVEELEYMGYNSEEIAILQNPDSTDDEIRTLSATLTIYTVIEKLDYHTNKWTYSTVYTQWQWSSLPFSPYRDDFAIVWTENMAFMPYSENNKSRYTLYKRNSLTGNVTTTTTGLTNNDYVSLASGVKTPTFFIKTSATPPSAYNFCYKGAARVALKHYGKVDWLQAQGGYSHYTYTVTGISLTAGFPSISFSPSTNYVYRAADDLVVNVL